MARTRATRPNQAAGGPNFVEVSPLQPEEVMENNEPRVCLSESSSEEHRGEAPINSTHSPTYVDLLTEMRQAQAAQAQRHQTTMAEMQRQMATLTRVVNVYAEHLPVETLRDPVKGKGTAEEDQEAPAKPRVPVSERLVFGGMKKEAAKARAGDLVTKTKGSQGTRPEDRPRASVFSRIGVPDRPEHSQSRSRRTRSRSHRSRSGKQESLSTARRSKGDSKFERGYSIPHEEIAPHYSLTPAELEVINAMRRSLGQVAHPPLQAVRAVELLPTGGSVAPGLGGQPFTPIRTPNLTGEVAGATGKHIVSPGATLGPFTPEVIATPYPPKFRGPTIPTFEGKTSPLEHVERYANLMQSQSVADAILCKHFTTTLAGPAADWFRQLARGSIASFAQLAQSLVDQFQSLHHQQKDSDHLLSLKQGHNETFAAFLKRFRAETLKVNNLCTKTAANAFKAAVADPHFLFKLSKEKMKQLSYVDLLRKADEHAEAQQHVAEAEATHGKREKRPYVPFPSDFPKDGVAPPKRGKGEYARDRPRVTRDYLPRIGRDALTTFTKPIDQIIASIDGKGLLRKASKLPAHSTKNKNKFCKYHRDYGHDTNNCFEARDQLEALAGQGYLTEFIKTAQKKEVARKQEVAREEGVAPPEGEDVPPQNVNGHVNVIFGGTGGGDSSNKRKRTAREARNEVYAIQATSHPRCPIIFTEEDVAQMHLPHNDALVIALQIDNVIVHRLLVDCGSSSDLLSWGVCQALGWTKDKLKPAKTPLVGFNGSTVYPLGRLELPIVIGTPPNHVTRITEFVITDSMTSYHGILGRPFIHSIRAALSSYHQAMRFPTPNGMGEARGEQLVSRECYDRALRPGQRVNMIEGPKGGEGDLPVDLTWTQIAPADLEAMEIEILPPINFPRLEGEVLGDHSIGSAGTELPLADPPRPESEEAGEAKGSPSADLAPAEKLEKVQLTASEICTSIGTELTGDQRIELLEFLRKNADVFAWSTEDMPGIDPSVAVHRLNVDPGVKPVKQKKRTMDAERSQAASGEVTKLLSAGFIREVEYPNWLSNIVLVRKPNGKWRMCIDFTNLNKACPKDSYPLPCIDQLVDATAGHELLSFMDAYSGYNQIRLAEADQEHTSFITDRGTYCYKVMPFGLKNAGATYQRMVNRLFANQIGRNMEVYVDDMLVKSRRATSHLDDLTETFKVLREHQMKLNPEKCVFGVRSGKFLGFIVHHRGIEANPEKIKAVLDLRSPTNIRQVQSLNGKVASLNRFISRAADKCLPFFETLRKGIKFEWSPECESALQELKRYLTSAPVLARPEAGEALFLYVAVSATAVSSVLIREDSGRQRPVYYVSKAFADAEKRYPELEKLALALIVSARRLRPYFQAHKVIVLTNFPLRQVLHKPEMSGRLMKWAIELSEYEIEYRPRTAIKGQVVAEFVAEFTESSPPEANPPPWTIRPLGASSPTRATSPFETWVLHVDGSSNEKGSGAGILLVSPEGNRYEYSIRFSFLASNNEAEYEALLAGLRLAKGAGATHVDIRSDSLLVVNQITDEYQAKDERMAKYLQVARNLISTFEKVDLKQVPRSQNSNADALARLAASHHTDQPRTVMVEILQEASIEDPEVNSVEEGQQETWITPIRNYLVNGDLPQDSTEAKRLARRAASYVIYQNKLYRRGFSLPMLRCLTPTEAECVIRETHEGICGDHAGSRSLAKKVIRQGFFWPTIRADTKKFTSACDRCQRVAPVPRCPGEQLTSIVSPWPFAQWGIDLIGPLPTAALSKQKYAVVAVDYFTKWAEAEPLVEITASAIHKFVWKNIICRFGIPHTIISDNGTQFENALFAKLCSDLGIVHRRSSPAHPQANGQVEAVNKTVKTLLKAKLPRLRSSWAAELPSVLWAYRTTHKSATGETPFSLSFGTEAVVPVEMRVPTFRVETYNPEANSEALRAELDLIEEYRDTARLRTIEQKKRVERFYNSRVKARSFALGDLVLRKVMPNTCERGAGVLQPTWEGPYRITSIARPGTYYLARLSGELIRHPWNVQHLRVYHT